MSESSTFFYASIGADLVTFAIDSDAASLTRQSAVTLPAWVQYAWQHPTLAVLYVVSSDGGPRGKAGEQHGASAFEVDPATGALTALGPHAPLPSRPIHCSVDRAGRHLLIAYNDPSAVTVHALGTRGEIGARVAQPDGLRFGHYGHQIRTTPGDASAILVTRGTDASAGRAEDPGSLEVFGFDKGRLSPRATVAPGDGSGFGFGPRHLDFHPTEPWVYVSVERQSELHLYDLGARGDLSTQPRFIRAALRSPTTRQGPQLAGTVRVHPGGRFAYQANRTGGRREDDGWTVVHGGEDNLVVYALDGATGEPTVIQHLDSPSIHVRTLSLHPLGDLAIAATIEAAPVRESNGDIRLVPAAIMTFRIGADGRLTAAHRYEVNTRGAVMWWSGMVTLA